MKEHIHLSFFFLIIYLFIYFFFIVHLYNKILQFELISFSKFWVDRDSQLEDDEQLARALQESLNLENVESPPPRYGHGNGYQPMPMYYPLGSR